MFFRDTIVAGKTILRSLRATSRKKTEKGKRRPRTNPSSEAVRRVNLNNAVRILTAKLNHNFKPGDYHTVLTYKTAPSKEEALKAINKFKRNVTAYCRKHDIEFKWVLVTEYEHTRIHHHMVMTGIDLKIIDKYWPHGYEYPTMLDETGNYYRLAEYLLKETEKTFRRDDAIQKRRYTTSRNVIMPQVKREKVAGREVSQAIRPPRGYHVDEDTVRRYEHRILGVDCMEYIMVNMDENKLLKKWKKGKPVDIRKKYKDYHEQEKQIRLDLPF